MARCERCKRPLNDSEDVTCWRCTGRSLTQEFWPSLRQAFPLLQVPSGIEADIPVLATEIDAVFGFSDPLALSLPHPVERKASRWRSWSSVMKVYDWIMKELTVSPSVQFCLLMGFVLYRRRLYRRYWGSRFRSDVRPVLRGARGALRAAEWRNLVLAGLLYQFFDFVFVLGVLRVFLACAAGKDDQGCLSDATEAMRTGMVPIALRSIGDGMAIPPSWIQEDALVKVSGWAAANITLKPFSGNKGNHLRAALERELARRGAVQWPYTELCKRLPANTWLAWHEGSKDQQALLSRIAYLVEHDVSDDARWASQRAPQQALRQGQERDDPTYEAVARRLETEDLFMAWLRKEAHLTHFEADVTRLKLEEPPSTHAGDRFTEQEIATMLGHRSLGSVKQAWHRAKPKIERVLKRALNE